MIAAVASLLSGAVRRLFTPGISALTWALLLITLVTGADVWTIDDLRDVPRWLILLVGTILLGLLMLAQWRLTREASDLRGRPGAVWPWVGWTVLAYLPPITAASVIAHSFDSEPATPLILQSALIALMSSLAVPLLVHADGRAIDAAGPDVREIWSHWKGDYPVLVAAFLVVTLPFSLLGNLIPWVAGDGLISEIGTALVCLPDSILGTLLTVEAFHRVPQKAYG